MKDRGDACKENLFESSFQPWQSQIHLEGFVSGQAFEMCQWKREEGQERLRVQTLHKRQIISQAEPARLNLCSGHFHSSFVHI